MGIRKVSDSLMVLSDSWTFYVGMLAGAFFAGMGILIAFFLIPSNLLLGIVFAFSGGLVMAVVKKTAIELDKGTGTFVVKTFSLFGSKKYDYSLQQIVKLQLRYSPNQSSRTLCVILSDGNVLSYINMIGEPVEATQAAQFLGVPLEVQGPPTYQQAAQAMKETAEYWGQYAAEQKKMKEKK